MKISRWQSLIDGRSSTDHDASICWNNFLIKRFEEVWRLPQYSDNNPGALISRAVQAIILACYLNLGCYNWLHKNRFLSEQNTSPCVITPIIYSFFLELLTVCKNYLVVVKVAWPRHFNWILLIESYANVRVHTRLLFGPQRNNTQSATWVAQHIKWHFSTCWDNKILHRHIPVSNPEVLHIVLRMSASRDRGPDFFSLESEIDV